MNAKYIKIIFNYTNNAYSVKVIKKYLNLNNKEFGIYLYPLKNEYIKKINKTENMIYFCEKYADETNPNAIMWNIINLYKLKKAKLTKTYQNILENYNKKIMLNETNKKMDERELFSFIFKNYKNRQKCLYESIKFMSKINDNENIFNIYNILVYCEIITTKDFFNIFDEYELTKEGNYDDSFIKLVCNSYTIPKLFFANKLSIPESKKKWKNLITKNYYGKNRKEILEFLDIKTDNKIKDTNLLDDFFCFNV